MEKSRFSDSVCKSGYGPTFQIFWLVLNVFFSIFYQQTEVSFFSKKSFKFSLKTLYFHIFVYETQNFLYIVHIKTQNTCTLHTNTAILVLVERSFCCLWDRVHIVSDIAVAEVHRYVAFFLKITR